MGLGTIVAAIAALGLFFASASTNRLLEATVQMERLAAKLEQMKAVQPETVQTIARLVFRPSYDCDQVACSTAVHARNSAAQTRLKAILAKQSGEMQSADGMPTINISTSSTREAAQK
jgi:hypothetical protein